MKVIDVAYPPAGYMQARSGTSITDFIVHHTAGNIHQTPLEICQEHLARGFATIGYNWLIGIDGTVYEGRHPGFVPSAAYGRNSVSVNVAVIGNFEMGDAEYSGPPSPQQIQSLKELCVYAHVTFPSIVRTIGHRDVALLFYPGLERNNYSTLCPGSQLYELIPEIKEYVLEKVHKGL